MRGDAFERGFGGEGRSADGRGASGEGRYVHPAAAMEADLDAMLTRLPDSVRVPDQIDAILQSVSRQQPLVAGRELRLRRWSRLVLGATAVGLSVTAVMTAVWLPELSGHADANRPVAGVMRSSQQAATLGFGGLEALSVRLGMLAQGPETAVEREVGRDEASLSGAIARSMLLPAAGLDRPLLMGHFEQGDGGAMRLVIESSEVLAPQVQTQVQLVSAIAESAWDRASRLARGSGAGQAPVEPETFADLLMAALEPAGHGLGHGHVQGLAGTAAEHEALHRPRSMPAVDAEGGASPAVKVFSLPPQ